MILQQERQRTLLHGRRSGAEMENKPGRNAEAIHALGVTFCGRRSHASHLLQTGLLGRNKSP